MCFLDITSLNMIGVLFFLRSQFSTYFPGYFDGQYWLWWVFLVLGKYKGSKHNLYFFSLFLRLTSNDIS